MSKRAAAAQPLAGAKRKMGTVASALEDFSSYLKAERRSAPLTVRAYLADIGGFLAFLKSYFAQKPTLAMLGRLSLAELRSYMAHLDTHSELTARSRSRKLSSLKMFFRFLAKRDLARNAAIERLRAPRFERAPPRPIPAAQALAVMDAENGEPPWIAARDRAALLLLYGAGLRISEALALTGEAVDGRDVLRILGKGGKEREVPLLTQIRAALEDYLRKLPFPLEPSELIFRGQKGRPLSPRVLQRRIEYMRLALGLDETATPHALRHAFATDLLRSGADLRSIQELLGHASLSTTQGYTQVDPTHLMAQFKKAHPRAK